MKLFFSYNSILCVVYFGFFPTITAAGDFHLTRFVAYVTLLFAVKVIVIVKLYKGFCVNRYSSFQMKLIGEIIQQLATSITQSPASW
jgi:hypothetical protein